MADALSFEAGLIASVPLLYRSKHNLAAVPVPVTVVSDNAAVAAVVVDPDGAGVKIAGLSPGTATVSVTLNDHSDAMVVSVGAPVADSATFQPGAATFASIGV